MRRALLAVPLAALWYTLGPTEMSCAAAGRRGPGSLQVVHTDPVWVPTVVEVNEWVHDGINAAALGIRLQDVPGVRRWVWGYPAGEPIGRGQSLRFVVVATPQFVGTVVGWTAAWEETTWARIQIDQDEVAAELTRTIARHWQRGRLLLAVGIEGRPEPADGYLPTIAMYYDGAWRCSGTDRFSTLEGFAEVGRAGRGQTALWATARALRDALNCSAFSDPDNTAVALLELERVPLEPLSTAFDPRLPTPDVRRPGWTRIAVGDPDSMRYVDLCLEDK